jgi:hypothetical protein
MDLQTNYADNLQVRAFAPLIYQATGLAKTEQNVEKAFSLSDFSYDLARIVSGGVKLMVLAINDPSIAARGIATGVKTVCNPQHWVGMGAGLLKLGVFLADEYGRQDSLDNAFDLGTLTGGKYDLFWEKNRENNEYHRKIRQAIQQEFHETSEKIKKLSDEELIEGVFSFGTTFMLDGLALKIGTLATTVEGRAVLSQCAEALTSPFAKEFALEAAGIGKLTLEEGADVVNMAIEVVEKNPKLIQTEGSFLGATKQVVDVEKLANKIRKVGDDILDLSEKAGGHTLEKHVSQTVNDLTKRAAQDPTTSIASTFVNKHTAINAVKENLRDNAEEIAQWLKSNPASKSQLVVDCLHKHPVGSSVSKGNKTPIYDLIKSRVVIRPDPDNILGFKIITAFPIDE